MKALAGTVYKDNLMKKTIEFKTELKESIFQADTTCLVWIECKPEIFVYSDGRAEFNGFYLMKSGERLWGELDSSLNRTVKIEYEVHPVEDVKLYEAIQKLLEAASKEKSQNGILESEKKELLDAYDLSQKTILDLMQINQSRGLLTRIKRFFG